MRIHLLVTMLLVSSPAIAQTRLAGDFERAALEKQLSRERDPIAAAAAHINLGDLDAARADAAAARVRFENALSIVSEYRLRARRESHLTDYATATAYAALASAKLWRRSDALALLEEAVRYLSDSPKIWNLYASSMMVLGEHRKAAAAARNAVAIANELAEKSPSTGHQLDVNIYRYALASALTTTDPKEAEGVLEAISQSLEARSFDSIRGEIARREAFEVFTSTTSDAEAFLSLHNRAGLRLGKLYEQRGATAQARAAYDRVLALRSDDAIALAALARLARTKEEKQRFFAAAFEANPFSMDLIREYERFVGEVGDSDPGEATVGARMRLGIQLAVAQQTKRSRAIFTQLASEFPGNATLSSLARKSETKPIPHSLLATLEGQVIEPSDDDLRGLLDLLSDDAATAAERNLLDSVRFSSLVRFESERPAGTPASPRLTTFTSGTIGAIRFRFAEATSFRGEFDHAAQLRLEYRILGVTEIAGRDGLLLEPIRVVRP